MAQEAGRTIARFQAAVGQCLAQTVDGYWCYEWAYAFEDALKLESGDDFSITVYSAAADDGRLHARATAS